MPVLQVEHNMVPLLEVTILGIMLLKLAVIALVLVKMDLLLPWVVEDPAVVTSVVLVAYSIIPLQKDLEDPLSFLDVTNV